MVDFTPGSISDHVNTFFAGYETVLGKPVWSRRRCFNGGCKNDTLVRTACLCEFVIHEYGRRPH